MRLSPVSEQPWIFFDCSGARDAPVPIWVGGHGEDDRYALPSIGELVVIWIELIEIGAHAVDDSGAWKDTDWDLVPERVQQLGVF
ncbi:MAG: hypothetical protein JWQ18_2996 [Conexibacter sp.]|nr:hypothetical protein [Conexibacter sp.]